MPSRPFSGRFSGGALSNSGRPTAPIRVASAVAAARAVSAGNGVPVLWIAIPPSRPSVRFRVCFHLVATYCRTRTASRVTSVPMPSPGRTRTLRFMNSVCQSDLGLPALVDQDDDFLVHEALLAVVGNSGEAMIEAVEFALGERITQFGGALVERVPAAVFAKHETAFGYADGARVDNLVGGFFLEIAILVDAGFMRERVAPNDGLVGLRAESDDRSQKLAGGEQ